MKEGLTLVQIPGRYGYGVTLVGWAEHSHGDWYDLHGAVSVVRTSGQRTLGQLAADGPMKDHRVNETAEDETPEQIHSWRVRRVRAASEKAWAKWCPKPKGWDSRERAP